MGSGNAGGDRVEISRRLHSSWRQRGHTGLGWMEAETKLKKINVDPNVDI